MTPKAYYDWWFYSGISPGIPTRPANYAALGERLSTSGVQLIILWELLLDNAQFDETTYIAPTGIFGSHQRIIEAARQVGATRLANYLSALPDATVVPDTHRELKLLLKEFSARHKAELAADVARHGDPRTAAGFDKKQARRKREEQYGQNNGRYQISDQIPFFTEPLKQLRTLLAQGTTLAELSRRRDQITYLICTIQYDVPRWAQSPQPPDVVTFLEECRQLSEQYPKQMPAWKGTPQTLAETSYSSPLAEVSKDQDVLDRLQAIGSYKAERIGPVTMVTWDSVGALKNEIAPMGLRFTYEGEFPPTLLAAWDDMPRRLAAALPAMTRELLALGRGEPNYDDEPQANDEELLSQISGGMLSITVDGNEPGCRVECSWEVEWDPEHGCTFEIDEQCGVRRVE